MAQKLNEFIYFFLDKVTFGWFILSHEPEIEEKKNFLFLRKEKAKY